MLDFSDRTKTGISKLISSCAPNVHLIELIILSYISTEPDNCKLSKVSFQLHLKRPKYSAGQNMLGIAIQKLIVHVVYYDTALMGEEIKEGRQA